MKAELEHAAAVFERTTRSRFTTHRDSTRVLRRSVQAIRRNRTPIGDGSGPAMLLDHPASRAGVPGTSAQMDP
ncbi:hypothetical protein ACH4FE_19860 [Streptomyces celluloflavus]|uniref:hypothetical protein n=1 Tax=Streptomyces celluloflavus TaxID=58344 RepID=UPI0037A1377F